VAFFFLADMMRDLLLEDGDARVEELIIGRTGFNRVDQGFRPVMLDKGLIVESRP